MRIGSYRVKADWGHLALAALMSGFCLWYLADARAASQRPDNLMLILPGALLALLLFVVIAFQEIKVQRVASSADEAATGSSRRWALPSNLHIPAFMALLGIYVFAMPAIGFDVATFLFMALSLAVQGERRWLVLIGYSLVFALLVTWAFKLLLSVPVPTLLGGS